MHGGKKEGQLHSAAALPPVLTAAWVRMQCRRKKFQQLPRIEPRSSSQYTDWTIGYVCNGDHNTNDLFILKLSSPQRTDRNTKICLHVLTPQFTVFRGLFPFMFSTVFESKLQMLYNISQQWFSYAGYYLRPKIFRAVAILLFLIHPRGRYCISIFCYHLQLQDVRWLSIFKFPSNSQLPAYTMLVFLTSEN